MKNINLKKTKGLLAKLPTVLVLLFAFTVLKSCTTQYKFSTSSVVPAAEGSVTVKKDNNSNYIINLHIKRLADPKRLDPAKDIYIVWMETQQNGIKNIGQLKTESGMFSSTLKSSLKTVSSFKPTGFFITAENDPNIQHPGSQIVLSTGSL